MFSIGEAGDKLTVDAKLCSSCPLPTLLLGKSEALLVPSCDSMALVNVRSSSLTSVNVALLSYVTGLLG